MESFLMKALQLVVALVILVTIHEFGHYFFARLFGIRVNRFYLFFNPYFSLLKYNPMKGTLSVISRDDNHSLATFQVSKPRQPRPDGKPTWRDTIYGLGWLPLGGYCDIAGMVDETKTSKDLEAEPQPWEFRTKAAWKRLLVMVGGVMFNFILAICIYIGIALHWGDRTVAYQDMAEGMDYTEPMHRAGFRDGDILLKINGKDIDPKSGATVWNMLQPGTEVTVLRDHSDTLSLKMPENLLNDIVETNKSCMTIRIPAVVLKTLGGEGAAEAGLLPGDRILAVDADTTPTLTEFRPAISARTSTKPLMTILRGDSVMQIPVSINSDGQIGIQLTPPDGIFPVTEVKYNFFESIPRGWEVGTERLTTYVESCKMLFTKQGAKSVGGFGTLGSMFPDKWDWYSFWQIAAFLSVILAFMNIIPIPGLDGGHTLFLLVEMVTRRKPSERLMEVANYIGMAFLLLLLVYANMNDVYRLVLK